MCGVCCSVFVLHFTSSLSTVFSFCSRQVFKSLHLPMDAGILVLLILSPAGIIIFWEYCSCNGRVWTLVTLSPILSYYYGICATPRCPIDPNCRLFYYLKHNKHDLLMLDNQGNEGVTCVGSLLSASSFILYTVAHHIASSFVLTGLPTLATPVFITSCY